MHAGITWSRAWRKISAPVVACGDLAGESISVLTRHNKLYMYFLGGNRDFLFGQVNNGITHELAVYITLDIRSSRKGH